MKDQILEGFVNNFQEGHALTDKEKSEVFEHFVNHCVISKQYPRDFDFHDIHTGGQGDLSIDGAAFIVNGNIVRTPEEVTYLCEQNKYLNVSLCFIQAKTSPKFSGAEVGNLLHGIRSFFSEKPTTEENDRIRSLREIKDEIYKNSIYLDSAPDLKLFFATTGEWKSPPPIVERVELELQDIKSSQLFSQITFYFYDADRLKQSYREINRRTTKEIAFSNHVALPDIKDVRQAFVGSISAKEYIDLITDSDGHLQRYLFDDNVRDFQGLNKVNRDIEETVKNNDLQAALAVLNNGITIIAKRVEPIGKKLKLTDFQVVNGCQTSHILFDNRQLLEDGTHIVVKIVETTDYEFATRVVKATNWQTEVKGEAFESVRPFHRDLEEFYKSMEKMICSPIYYERRSKQYDGMPSVKPFQVVTLPMQINAYVAGKLGQPQSTHRYYGELLKSNRDKLFQEVQTLGPYFVCALILKRLEGLFNSDSIRGVSRRMKYHLLFVIHAYYDLRSKKDKSFNHRALIHEIDDRPQFTRVVHAASQAIEKILDDLSLGAQEAARSRKFTEELRREIDQQFKSSLRA